MTIRRIRVGRTGHRYEIDEKKAFGVTTALDLFVARPGLMSWAARCAAEEALRVFSLPERNTFEREHEIGSDDDLVTYFAGEAVRRRNAAAVRGTRVHKFAEKMVKGDPVDVPEELVPYVQNCARFFDEWKIAPLLKETVVGSHRWGYAGTFDLVAAVPDGRRILFDYKTGKRVAADVKFQLAAYRHAEAYLTAAGMEIPMAEVGITDSKVVHLRPEGYDVIPMDSGEPEFKVFLHGLQVARALDGMKDWVPLPEAVPR